MELQAWILKPAGLDLGAEALDLRLRWRCFFCFWDFSYFSCFESEIEGLDLDLEAASLDLEAQALDLEAQALDSEAQAWDLFFF